MTREAAPGTAEGGEALTRGHKKKARTRQQLLEAALRIYARKGAGELALNELAEEAGVSNGTVYNYFRTREEVLEAVGLELAVQLSRQVATVSAGISRGAERLAIGVRTFLLKAKEDPEWAGALISVVRYAEGIRAAFAAYVRADLQAGFQQGDFCYRDEGVALMLVISATTGAMAMVVEGQEAAPHDGVVAEMILLALGAPAPEARRIACLPVPQVVAEAEVPAAAGRRRP